MQLTIKPQDRTQPEKLELELHPALIRRLNAYADSLGGSDLNYVVAQILEQVLPPEKADKKSKNGTADQPAKTEGKTTAKRTVSASA